MPKGCYMSNIEYLDCQFMRRSKKLTTFYPFLGPNKCQPLDFCEAESRFPKDASYHIWFKSV